MAEAFDLLDAMELADGESGSENEEAEEMESVAGESSAAAKPEEGNCQSRGSFKKREPEIIEEQR